jgi:hypothetical protein
MAVYLTTEYVSVDSLVGRRKQVEFQTGCVVLKHLTSDKVQ